MDAGESFVLESTLSGNYLMKVIEKANDSGYSVKIVYIFLETPKDCIQRIRIRVTLGGHSIPDEDVIRRYYRSKINFWNDYKNLAKEWVIMYNSVTRIPKRIAIGSGENYFVEEENSTILPPKTNEREEREDREFEDLIKRLTNKLFGDNDEIELDIEEILNN